MNKLYNLKQDKFFKTQPMPDKLATLKTSNLQNRRENEILNGFVIMIGIVGFLAAFLLPRDLIYNRSSLENSFSNNSNQLASSSLSTDSKEKSIALNMDQHFHIEGYHEAGEILKFNFESYSPYSEVFYTLDFGNGVSKRIKNKVTTYQYSSSGKYTVKLMANFEGETKEIYKSQLFIDDAIIVQTEAFLESK